MNKKDPGTDALNSSIVKFQTYDLEEEIFRFAETVRIFVR